MGNPQEHYPNEAEVARIIRMKAWRLIEHSAFRNDDVEDIQQDLMLHWLQRRRSYDSQRGELVTFADFVLNRKIQNMLAERKAGRRDYRLCWISLDDRVAVDDDDKGLSRHEKYDQDDYYRRMGLRARSAWETQKLQQAVRNVITRLPARQRELAVRLMSQNMLQAAQEMGVPRATLYGWREQIHKAFENAGLRDYL